MEFNQRPTLCPYCNEIFKKIAIIHNRTKFYGKEIYWYQLYNGEIPPKFVNILDTDYYEFGGNHIIALTELKDYDYKIIMGNDI